MYCIYERGRFIRIDHEKCSDLGAAHDEEGYIKYLKSQGASPNTIRSCLTAVRQYKQFYSCFDREHLLLYRDYLLNHYKASTVDNRIYGINRFLNYMALTYTHEAFPGSFRLPVIRKQNVSFLDHVISQKDYEKLKQCLKRDKDDYWYFVIRFMACSGARVSELVQMKQEHLKMGYMDLYTIGGKVRRIYFPEKLCQEALAWSEVRHIDSGFLFTNQRGDPISPRWIRSQLKVLAKRYGIPEETMYPHSFRHRFAKNFLKRFQDISLLADLMGHESIETTRIYLTKSTEEQREIIDRIVTW